MTVAGFGITDLVPKWAGKPPPGLHLDVMKDGKRIQKLMIDEKKCYFFGRNKQLCDFSIDHSSCSRVHSALVWHEKMQRPFIVDLGSTHGTYVAGKLIEARKPQFVPVDLEIRFGASTRTYAIRERVQSGKDGDESYSHSSTGETEGNYLNLPESEGELDNLTEYNTAHNRRIASIQLPDMQRQTKRKRHHFSISLKYNMLCVTCSVHFNDEETVINPEDVDPSVGRFRNLVETSVIPNKRPRLAAIGSGDGALYQNTVTIKPVGSQSDNGLYSPTSTPHSSVHNTFSETFSMASKLGLRLPNLAPDLSSTADQEPAPKSTTTATSRPTISPRELPAVGANPAALYDPNMIDRNMGGHNLVTLTPVGMTAAAVVAVSASEEAAGSAVDEKRHKVYAKESWPGRGPVNANLLV